MRVGVDGRSLAGDGRGVAAYAAGMLSALDGRELRVLLPRGAALPACAAAEPVPHPAPSRLLHGAAAVARRPRLERLVGGADVVWLPAPAPVAIGHGTPIVLTVHDLSFLERPQDFTRYERAWHKLARTRAVARRAARVVTDTEAAARSVRERLGVPEDRIAVVGAGPGDPGAPVTPREIAAARARHGLPERYLLYLGALEPRKAVDVLAAAHARAGADAALVLAGEGRLVPRGPGIHALGRVARADKAALLAGALAVVLPSRVEGYGYPPLEGYAHGTPAIASDLPALRETAGGGAVYVRPGDVAALVGALRELAHDEPRRRRLAERGAAALAGRTWEASARALHAVLEAAAAGRA
jgi:glycosyltransferase involved in cell wall biosynthesis